MYLIPLLIAFSLIIYLIVQSKANKRLYRNYKEKISNNNSSLKKIYLKIKTKYESKLLKYTKLSFNDLLRIKLIIFITVLLLILFIKETNINFYIDQIFSSYDYKTDIFRDVNSSLIDTEKSLEQEKIFLEKAIKEIDYESIVAEYGINSKEEIEFQIRRIINEFNIDTELPIDTLENKLYFKLTDYHKYTNYNIPFYLILSVVVTFILELYFYIKNLFSKFKAHEELRFLKRLVILQGSVKPVIFNNILENMIERSKYHKKVLKDIKNSNQNISVNPKNIYSKYISKEKDLNTKLFYEKLDEANNYDFDLAIKNIKNEFEIEKSERKRAVRKRIEVIHVWGVAGFILILGITMFYLLIIWTDTYNLDMFL